MWSTYRLHKVWEFSEVFKQGKKVINSEFLVFYLPNHLNTCRLGISVPRKIVKKATQRNYCKRQIKNILASSFLREHEIICPFNQPNHYDLVIVIRPNFLMVNDFSVKQKSLAELLDLIPQKKLHLNNLVKNKRTPYA